MPSRDHIEAGAPPVIIGEVLFDSFPDGTRVLGGAPFNVAWHLQAFGHAPIMVTRIGDDDAGHEVMDRMADWCMDRRGVQVDPVAPTGRVEVAFSDGEPSYEIVADQAYDRISAKDAGAAVRQTSVSLLYHGTLAARSAPSRRSIRILRGLLEGAVFVDLNLRAPWWTRDGVQSLADRSTWIKLNVDELDEIADDGGGPLVMARQLRRRTGAEQVVVTRGEVGALAVTADSTCEGVPEPGRPVADTVGAGDAFSAVWIAGLLRGWSVSTTLSRALDFAARICSIRGATTNDRSLYQGVIASWHPESG